MLNVVHSLQFHEFCGNQTLPKKDLEKKSHFGNLSYFIINILILKTSEYYD